MAKLTKRQKAIAAAIEANKVYTLEEAVAVLALNWCWFRRACTYHRWFCTFYGLGSGAI